MIYEVLLLSQASFGAHFTRNFFTVFVVYLIDSQILTPAGYGFVLSLISLSSLIGPLYTGYLASSIEKSNKLILIHAIIILFSQILFAASIRLRSFLMTAIAWLFFGISATSVTTLQRALISRHLKVHAIFATCRSTV
jgi:hypothetical protein